MSNFQPVDLNRLPYGNQEFSDLREQNMIYVDKTALIYQIASQRSPIFFSRPRRFGKSLLINTLASLFANGLKYFQGLDIEKKWTDKTYQVVHLDFSDIADYSSMELKEDLGEIIIEQFKMKGIVDQRNESGIRRPNRILDEICENLNNNSIVLLVDEYDAPLTHHINQEDELKSIMKVLNSFYSIIKKHSGKFRFIFITGVTRVSYVSIFSAFNNLKDLSYHPDYNTLLGFIKNELVEFFDPYIDNAAYVLHLSKKEIYEKIASYYDGFQFSPEASETLYNPWSILNFLQEPNLGFQNYWFLSGGLSSLVIQSFKVNNSFDFMAYSEREISTTRLELQSSYDILDIPKEILLFQAGYLTLRTKRNKILKLVPTNTEIEESLIQLYIMANNMRPKKKIVNMIENFDDYIDEHKLSAIVDTFNSILNTVVSINSKIFEDERSVRDIIFGTILMINSVQGIKENQTLRGFSDLELITSKTHMIIEFKRTYPGNPKHNPSEALFLAIDQIKNRNYSNHHFEGKSLYRVAMVISTEEKKILSDYCRELN